MGDTKESSKLGFIFLLLGIALFSTVEICQKLISAKVTIDPNVMVCERFIITGIILFIFGLPNYLSNGNHITFKDWMIFFLNGLIGITLSLGLFHLAISQFANASSAAVVFSANSIFAIIFARFINHENWSVQKLLALILGLCGISLFMFEGGKADMAMAKPIGVMCGAAMLFGLSICITKRFVGKYGAMLYMGGSSIIGGILSLPMIYLTVNTETSSFPAELLKATQALPEMAYMVIVATALAYVLYYTGIAGTSVYVSSISFFLKPVLACVFAMVAKNVGLLSTEKMMNPWTIGGTVLILVAMALTVFKKQGGGASKAAPAKKEAK